MTRNTANVDMDTFFARVTILKFCIHSMDMKLFTREHQTI